MIKRLTILFAMLISIATGIQAQVSFIVADGTSTNSYVPIYGLWADDYTRSQMVYPASMLEDLNPGDEITSLTYFAQDASQDWGAATFEVKLGEVSATTFSSYLSDASTTVYSGAVTVSNNQMVVTFTTPYTYQGGNLLVEFYQTAAGTYHSESFYGVSASGASASGYNSSGASSASFNQRDFLPKMEIEYLPGTPLSCYRVKNLQATDIDSNSLTLQWLDTMNSGASYTVAYWVAGSTDTTYVYVSDTSTVITDLSASTQYFFSVVPNCSDGSTAGAANGSWRTTCGTASIPFNEGFESFASQTAPECWTVLSGNPQAYGSSTYAHSGNNVLRFVGSTPNTIALPPMGQATGSLQVRFWTRPEDYTNASCGNFTVGYMTDLTVDSTFVPLQTWAYSDFSAYEEMEVPMVGAPDNAYIVMRQSNNATNWYWFVDDLVVEPIPSCARPTAVSISNITSDGADITVLGTDNSDFRIYWADTAIIDSADLNGNVYTLTGLSANTSYTITAVTLCGDGTVTRSVGTTFRTACGGYTPVPYTTNFDDVSDGGLPECWTALMTGSSGSGTFPSVYNYSTNSYSSPKYFEFESNSGVPEMVALPAMDNISSLAFKFYASAMNQNFVLEVGVLDGDNFDVVDTITLTLGSNGNWHNGYHEYTVYFANYTGSGDRIALRVTGTPGSSYTLMMDDFSVETFSGCYPVSNVNITDITPDGMTVNWEDNFNSGATYTVYYRMSGNTADTTVVTTTNTSYTVTGLQSNKKYYFAVEVDCGGGNVSDVSPTVNATTLLACPKPTALTIDTVTTDEITLSWTPGYEETSWLLGINDSLVMVTTNPYTITNLNSNTAYTLTLSALCSDSDTSASSSISVRTDCENGSCNIVIYAVDGYGDGWNGNTINVLQGGTVMGSYEMPSQNMYSTVIYDTTTIQVCAGDSVTLTYNSGSYADEMGGYITDGGGNIIYLIEDMDNLSSGAVLATLPEPCPSCMAPTAVTVDTITPYEITIHWTAGGSETEWNISVNDSLISNVTANPYTITGLDQYTLYSISVAALCSDDGVSGYSLPISVRTAVACPWPTNFAATVNGDTATLHWNGMALSYEVVYGTYGFAIDTVDASNYIPVTDTTMYEITGLTAGLYHAYVRSVCSDSYSVWTGPVSFGVGYTNIDQVDTMRTCGAIICDNGGPNGSYDNNRNDQVVVYPVDGTHGLVLSGHSQTEGSYDYLTIYEGVGTSGNILFQDQTSGNYSDIPFGPFDVFGPVTITFHSDGSSTYPGFEVSVGCFDITGCIHPFGLSVTDISSSDVSLSWMNSSTTGYVVTITDGAGYSDSVSVADTFYTFTGLSPLTNYYINVYSDCGTELSDASSITVTTLMVADSLPYSCGFENGENWMLANGSEANKWAIGEATSNGGTHALYISNDNGATNGYNTGSTSNVYAYKMFDFVDAGDYAISFDWKANGESSFDYLRVFIVPATTEPSAGDNSGIGTTSTPAGWQALDGGSKLNLSNNWQNHTEIFNVATAGSYNVIFFWHNDASSGSQPPAAIDNIQISALSCSAPTGLTATNVTGTSADLNWTAGGSESEWIVTVNGVSTQVSTNAYSLTGLANSTDYTVSVRAICGAGDTSFASPSVTFTTAMCDNGSITYNYGSGATTGTTSSSPIGYSLYNYSYVQVIVPASQLAGFTAVDALGYNPTNTTSSNFYTNTTIYMANVSENDLSAGFIHPDANHTFVTVKTNADLSFTSTGWQTVALDSVFTWDGTSNVLVAFKRDHGSWASSGSFAAHNDSVARTRYVAQDGGSFDIATVSGGSASTTVGDLMLISCGGAVACETPLIDTVSATENSVTMAYTGTSSNYEVAIVQGAWVAPAAGTLTAATTYTFSGLVPEISYTVGVRAVCSGSYSSWTVRSITTPAHACAVPTNVSAISVTSTTATISWTDGEAGQSAWQIAVAGTGFADTVDVTTNPYTLTGLPNGVTYTVKVRAVCGEGSASEWSAPATFTTTSCEPVTGVTVNPNTITANSAVVSWTAPQGATNFEIEYGMNGFNQGNGTIVAVTGTSHTLTGLSATTVYDVYVRTVCGEGVTSAWSSVVDFTTADGEGIDDVNSAAISLYPNPASSTVTLTGIEGAAMVTVVDMNGRETGKWTVVDGTLTIDVTEMAQGAYFVRIVGEQVNAIRKLIVR